MSNENPCIISGKCYPDQCYYASDCISADNKLDLENKRKDSFLSKLEQKRIKKNETTTSKNDDSGQKVFYMFAIDQYEKLTSKYPIFKPAICGSVGRLLHSITNAYDIKYTKIDYSVGDLDLIIDLSQIDTIPDCFTKTDQDKLTIGSGYLHYRYKDNENGFKVCLFVVNGLITKKIFGYNVQYNCSYNTNYTNPMSSV